MSRTPKQIMADVKAQHAREEKAAEQPWPDPERFATPVTELDALPTTARSLAKLCDVWSATSARGPVPAAPGSTPPWRMADSVMLKGRVGRRLFSAVWLETAAGRMGLSLAYAHGVGKVGTKGLRAYLTEEDGIPWIEGVESIPLGKEASP